MADYIHFTHAPLCYNAALAVFLVSMSVCLFVCVRVCHKSAFYQKNVLMDLAGFWRGGILPSMIHCILRKKFGYLQK